jgi:hypothetical protein
MENDDLFLLDTTLFSLSEKTRGSEDTPCSDVLTPKGPKSPLFMQPSFSGTGKETSTTVVDIDQQQSMSSGQKGGAKRKKTQTTKKEDIICLSVEQMQQLTVLIQRNVSSEDKSNKPVFRHSQERINNYTDFIKKLMTDETETSFLEDVLNCGETKLLTQEEREKKLIKDFYMAMKTSILDNFDILIWFHQALLPKQKRPKTEMQAQESHETEKRVVSVLDKFCQQFGLTPAIVVEQLLKSTSIDEIMESLGVEDKNYFRCDIEKDIAEIRKEMSIVAPHSCTDTSLVNILTSLKKNLTDTAQKKVILKALFGFITDHADELSFDDVVVPVNNIQMMSLRGTSEIELTKAVESVEQYARHRLNGHRQKQFEEKIKETIQFLSSLPYSPENWANIEEIEKLNWKKF